MSFRSKIVGTLTAGGVMTWFVVALFGTPLLLALGLWLLGIHFDWSSWKTYAGLVALSAAMSFSK